MSDGSARRALVEKAADFVVRRRLTTPAILFLEMHRPVSFVVGQLVIMLMPFLSPFFPPRELEELVRMLEDRSGIDLLVSAIEDREAAGVTVVTKGES